MIKTIKTSEEYFNHLLKNVPDHRKLSVLQEAYKNALDTRKFEIDLYWKRATYFWAFIAALFIALYTILNLNGAFKSGSLEQNSYFHIFSNGLTIGISFLGFIFSLGWYFVNRGSKIWQKNWETHIDFLEDYINGPLFKTVIKPNLNFYSLNSYYPYSVSKVNQMLSLIVVAFWWLIMNSLCYLILLINCKLSCAFSWLLICNAIIYIFCYWFHRNTVSFMYKEWNKNAPYGKTYIDIE